MKLRLPTPLHGWRAFFGEVGVVVLGILIALGVDQAAKAVGNARDAAEARQNIRAEVVANITRVQQRGHAQGCVDRRLDELQALLDDAAADGRIPRPNWIGRPTRYGIESERWNVAVQSGRSSYFEPEEQAQYGMLYNTLIYFYEMQNSEQLVWARLSALDGFDRLSEDSRVAMRAALGEARFYNGSIRQITPNLLDRARQLGMTPTRRVDEAPTICWPIHLPTEEARARLEAAGGSL